MTDKKDTNDFDLVTAMISVSKKMNQPIDRDFIKAVIERFLLDTGVTLEEYHYLAMHELTDPHCNADASILYYNQLIEDAFSSTKISDKAKIYYASRFINFIMIRIYGDVE